MNSEHNFGDFRQNFDKNPMATIRMIRSRPDRILPPWSEEEKAAVRAFAVDVKRSLERDFDESLACEVSCVYLLDDPDRLDLLTLARACASAEAVPPPARRLTAGGLGVELTARSADEGRASQGCKIRFGRNRIIRIVAIEILSEFYQKSARILWEFVRNL